MATGSCPHCGHEVPLTEGDTVQDQTCTSCRRPMRGPSPSPSPAVAGARAVARPPGRGRRRYRGALLFVGAIAAAALLMLVL